MNTAKRPPNRLIHETSPYLRQHAHNPVDWHAWDSSSLERAKREDKPIFLSIGYSACHWCHVMEHESFEDDETAGILNENFISIKVDREERPDLDNIYMNAVTALTGHGGWPMSVFLTPELKPFYGGTYFPPTDSHQLPSFKRVLLGIVEAWTSRRAELAESATKITNHLQTAFRITATGDKLNATLIQNAVRGLERVFDPRHGGFGQAPKFPHPFDLKLLLRASKRFDDDEALNMARLTLDRMAMGGIYDHLGGGFHRYSTDTRWLVPHFEKMLYDNALLVPAYLEAYQLTGDVSYRTVVEETLAWVGREMVSPEGGFYSTIDADSEGVEGKFHVWSSEEIEKVLGQELAEVFLYVYDVSPEGNWEGHNIFNRSKTHAQTAKLLGLSEEDLQGRLADGNRRLLEVRNTRSRPARDEKVLTAWNGLMIAAYAQAAVVLGKQHLPIALSAAEFITATMRSPNGRLLRTWGAGGEAKLNGYLEDYSFMIDALVSLYEACFDEKWIGTSLELADMMIEQFWDETDGGFFYTGKDHETLIVRNKDI